MSAAQNRGRPRRLRRWALIFLASPFVLLVFGNLIGATPLATGIIEERIERHLGLGLDCEIAGLGWTPWSGGVVRDLKLRSSQSNSPFVEVGKVTIDPSWRSMLQRKKRFDSLIIENVTLNLTLEELREILAARKARPQIVQPKVTEKSSKKNEEEDEEKEPKLEAKENPDSQKSDPTISSRPSPVTVPVDDFEGEVILKNIALKFSSTKHPELAVELDEIEGEIPLWGQERSGRIIFSKVRIGNDGNTEKLDLPLTWKKQGLEINESQMHILGVTFSLAASVRLTQGLPFGIGVDLPAQRINFTSMGNNAPPIDLDQFRCSNKLQGYLLYPSLLHGSSRSQVGKTDFRDAKDGSHIRFDHGRAELTLNPAGLYARDFHLIGSEEAILGNGHLSSSGEGAAVVRIVASPERAEGYAKRVKSVSRDWELAFEPLITPDRLYRDLLFDLSNGTLVFDIGKDRKVVSFRDAFAKIKHGRQPIIVPEIP